MWADAGIDPNNASMVMQMRPLWHKMLRHQIQRLGIEVSFGKRVVEYFEDPDRGAAGVMTDDGERAEAGVVLAADGVNSRSRDIVMPNGNNDRRSGRSVYRSAYPLELAMADLLNKELFGPRDGKYLDVEAWLGPDTHLVALCNFDKDSNDRQMVWGITFFDKGEQTTKESWHHTVSSEDVLGRGRGSNGEGDSPRPHRSLALGLPQPSASLALACRKSHLGWRRCASLPANIGKWCDSSHRRCGDHCRAFEASWQSKHTHRCLRHTTYSTLMESLVHSGSAKRMMSDSTRLISQRGRLT